MKTLKIYFSDKRALAFYREQMGHVLYKDFCTNISPNILNKKLVNFIADLPSQSKYPVDHFAGVEEKTPRFAWGMICRHLKK